MLESIRDHNTVSDVSPVYRGRGDRRHPEDGNVWFIRIRGLFRNGGMGYTQDLTLIV